MNERDIIKRLETLERENEWLRRQVSGIPVRFAQGGPSGKALKFGKATANWTSGNTVTLTPCDSGGTATGEPNVTADIFSPNRGTIASVQINANDICTYLVTGTNTGILVAVNSGISTLGTTKNQVFAMTTSTTAAWGRVKAMA